VSLEESAAKEAQALKEELAAKEAQALKEELEVLRQSVNI